jgi:hypothetical protein
MRLSHQNKVKTMIDSKGEERAKFPARQDNADKNFLAPEL